MIAFSEKNAIQEIIKAAQKYIKNYLGDFKLELQKKKILKDTFFLNISDLNIKIQIGKIKALWDVPIIVELTNDKSYTITINDAVFKKDMWPELVRMGYEQGLRTGNLGIITKYFAESIILIIFSRYNSKYNLATENYNKVIIKKIIEIGEKWNVILRTNINKLVNIIKYLGALDFKDYTDREPAREGFCQGISIRELPPDLYGAEDSLKAILNQWNTSLKKYEEIEKSHYTTYTIYDFNSFVLENELIRAICRIASIKIKTEKIKELLTNPSLERVYEVLTGSNSPIMKTYNRFMEQLDPIQKKKLDRELRFIKLQERKYNRLLLVSGLSDFLTEDPEIKYLNNNLIKFNRSKYDELVNGTIEYAINKKIVRNLYK